MAPPMAPKRINHELWYTITVLAAVALTVAFMLWLKPCQGEGGIQAAAPVAVPRVKTSSAAASVPAATVTVASNGSVYPVELRLGEKRSPRLDQSPMSDWCHSAGVDLSCTAKVVGLCGDSDFKTKNAPIIQVCNDLWAARKPCLKPKPDLSASVAEPAARALGAPVQEFERCKFAGDSVQCCRRISRALAQRDGKSNGLDGDTEAELRFTYFRECSGPIREAQKPASERE